MPFPDIEGFKDLGNRIRLEDAYCGLHGVAQGLRRLLVVFFVRFIGPEAAGFLKVVPRFAILTAALAAVPAPGARLVNAEGFFAIGRSFLRAAALPDVLRACRFTRGFMGNFARGFFFVRRGAVRFRVFEVAISLRLL